MGFRGGAVSIDLDGMQLDFFDHWLKGKQNGVADSAPVKIYVMGLNEWRDEKEWPLPGTEWRRYYLHSRGRANSAAGDGALSTETPGDEPADSLSLQSAQSGADQRRRALLLPQLGARAAPSIRLRSSSAPTCWSTRPRRWPRISK